MDAAASDADLTRIVDEAPGAFRPGEGGGLRLSRVAFPFKSLANQPQKGHPQKRALAGRLVF